jgi:hypothetical protein
VAHHNIFVVSMGEVKLILADYYLLNISLFPLSWFTVKAILKQVRLIHFLEKIRIDVNSYF